MRIKQPVPPCIDCVTLPICRTILTNKNELFNMRLLNLLKKCSLLSDYVHYTEDLMTCKINRAVIVITSNRIQVEELYKSAIVITSNRIQVEELYERKMY